MNLTWFMANVKSNSNLKCQNNLDFDIQLAFACLPCLPQAGAGRDFDIWISPTKLGIRGFLR